MHIREPARDLPVLGEYDVVVCGGGPAGCAAGVASARRGARTLLVEREGFLGGATVAQLVVVVLSTNGVDFQGIWHEYARGLKERDGIRELTGAGSGQLRSSVDPETVKFVWDELLTEAGAEILHHAWASTCVVEDGRARGVIVETKAGRRAIRAKRVIDCTADGVVAAASGVGWDQGDGERPWAMALTKVFRMGGVTRPDDWPNAAAMAKLEADLTVAIERGDYDAPVVVEKRRLLNYIRGWHWELPERRRETLSVISRVLEVDPLDPFDLTRAEREGREQAWQAADFMRRYVPGMEDAHLLDTSAHIGVRSSRRLHGLATVTSEDAWRFRKTPDEIARSSWNIDVWPAASYSAPAVPYGEAEYKERIRRMRDEGEYFSIPYGCVVASGLDNLLMAGRCISAEHEAEASLRIQQTCMATGQAAGTAAAMSIERDTTPRELDASAVAGRLRVDRDAVRPAFECLEGLPVADD